MRTSRLALIVMLMSSGQLLAQSENNENPPSKLSEMLVGYDDFINKQPNSPVGYRFRAMVWAELSEESTRCLNLLERCCLSARQRCADAIHGQV